MSGQPTLLLTGEGPKTATGRATSCRGGKSVPDSAEAHGVTHLSSHLICTQPGLRRNDQGWNHFSTVCRLEHSTSSHKCSTCSLQRWGRGEASYLAEARERSPIPFGWSTFSSSPVPSPHLCPQGEQDDPVNLCELLHTIRATSASQEPGQYDEQESSRSPAVAAVRGETTAALEPALSSPELLTPRVPRVSRPDNSLQPNADEGTKLHVHLCMCRIVCHVHSLNCLQGGKMCLPPSQLSLWPGWAAISAPQSNAALPRAPHPHPVPPASSRGAEPSSGLHFLLFARHLASRPIREGLGDS